MLTLFPFIVTVFSALRLMLGQHLLAASSQDPFYLSPCVARVSA